MKFNLYLLFALLGILVSYSLAVEISKQETTKTKEVADKVGAKDEEENYGVNYGGGGGGGNYGGGGSGWGGGCRHGCCYRGYRGSCNKCCASPEEAKAVAENEAKSNEEAADTHKVEANGEEGQYGVNYGGGGGGGNYGGGGGGSGWGGGCRHGCCYRGYRGSCNKCCVSPEEAKAVKENQEKTTKEAADTHKVEAKGEEGQYGVNYGGGGGGGHYGGGGGGSNWGGGCRHGCCYRGHGGSCNKCCSSPQEAKAFAENQSRP